MQNALRFPLVNTPVVRLIIACSTLFALLIFAAQALGNAQPLPEALQALHLTDCALPCWMGITPGQTTFDEALQHLTQSLPMNVRVQGSLIYADYQPSAPMGRVSLQGWDNVIFSIHLTPGRDAGLAVGDIVELFGNPGCEVPSSHMMLIYSSTDAFAAVLASHEVREKWRKPLINIEIRGARPICEFF